MNVLIIGNGFDVAHGLPTTYKDFMHFINVVEFFRNCNITLNDFITEKEKIYSNEGLKEEVIQYFENYFLGISDTDITINDYLNSNPDLLLNNLLKYSNENIWIKYFNQKILEEDNYWAGFENNISKIIQGLDKFKPNIIEVYSHMQPNDLPEELKKFLELYLGQYSCFAFRDFKNKIIEDLNNLIKCLEIYLYDCVNNLPIKIFTPYLFEANIDKVLCFNYTNTFERCNIYGNKKDVCYIHGKADANKNDNNMVLGIDEYLNGDDKNNNTEFIEFKKYYQRIHKKTGCEYKKWLDEINDQRHYSENHLYVWGHSLAITDKDILKEFFLSENIDITIFYHSKSQYGKQIAHLVTVLGQENLISMVYGKKPKIKFLEQDSMLRIDGENKKIENDIYILNYIDHFGNNVFETIISKVTDRLKNRDLAYFENVAKFQKLFSVIKEKCPAINYDNRRELDNVNEMLKKAEESKATLLNEDNLYTVYKILDSNLILSFEDVERVFEKLYLLHTQQNSNIDLIWLCLLELSKKVSDIEWHEIIDKKIKQLPCNDYIERKWLSDLKNRLARAYAC